MIKGILIASLSMAVALEADAEEGFELLDREEEVALAESAGLPPWNRAATIYVLGPSGYEKARTGDNGFTCMVGRSDPGTRWPICFDAVGSETILPRYLREGALRQAGKSEDEVRADTAGRFLSGEYEAPARTGVAYMLSEDAITSNGRDLILAPPHIMVYAPNVEGEAIGAVAGHAHSPMVLFEGDPHGYIVVFVNDTLPELKRLGPVPAREN